MRMRESAKIHCCRAFFSHILGKEGLSFSGIVKAL